MLSVLICLIGITVAMMAQQPCSPMDPGEWTPVKPVLYPKIYEATEEELLLYPGDSMFQSELRLNGVIDTNSPNGMVLEPQGDFLIVNPAEVFKFETVSGQNIIRLIKPLDRDGPTESYDDDTDVITFTLKCSPASNLSIEIFYDVSVMVMDKNDNPPMFVGTPFETTINELAPIGSQILTVTAVDEDSNLDGNITYSIVKNAGIMNDGSDLFDIDTLKGSITVKDYLDYESLSDGHKYYVVRVVVTDGGPITKRSAYSDVMIHVTDGNDNGPSFVYTGCLQHKMACIWPTYTTDINAIVLNKELNFRGVPDVSGNNIKIQGKDMDSMPSDISFSIATTYPPGYDSYFSVETVKMGQNFQAIVKQVKVMEFPSIFEIFVKAEELPAKRRYDIAMILFVGQTSNNQGNIPTTTQAPVIKTDAPNSQTTNDSKDAYTQTTVALIVVVAITLTIVVCLAIAIICITLRGRRHSPDKAPLFYRDPTPVKVGQENSGFSAQL